MTNKINLNNLGLSEDDLTICSPFTINNDIDADLTIFFRYTLNILQERPNIGFDGKDFLANSEIIYPSDFNSRPLVGFIIVNVGIGAPNDVYKKELQYMKKYNEHQI